MTAASAAHTPETHIPQNIVVANIRKSYGANTVLRGVDLTFRAGEVHALLGANGAGKSTFLGCLSGAVTPDGGSISIGERTYASFTPSSAINSGTAIIYQHFQLIGSLTVSDNVFLGSELRDRAGRVRRNAQREQTRQLLTMLGSDLQPSTLVETLGSGSQQIVEIARALRHSPRLLILDEPTAALSVEEEAALLEIVRRLAHDEGLAIVYVTHLLREVVEVADSVTVLRDGRVMWTKPMSTLVIDDLVTAIAPEKTTSKREQGTATDRPIIELRDYQSSKTGPVNVTVHGGEILGVFGLLGSGRTDFLESLAGVRKAVGGQVVLDGVNVRLAGPARARRNGVVFVASDRKAQSLFPGMTATENLLLPHYSAMSTPLRKIRRERSVFGKLAKQVKLVPPDGTLNIDLFSGGNAQKIAVGRWLTGLDNPSIIVLDEPTQGVDIGARQDIYGLLRQSVEGGERAIIFASSDPEEIVALADRVVVLAEGDVIHIGNADLDEIELQALAHGRIDHDNPAGRKK